MSEPTRRLNGKRPPKNAPALKFGDYHDVASETYPPVNYLTDYQVEPMDGNNSYGDCVVVGYANWLGLVSAVLGGTETNLTMDQVLAYYQTQNPTFDPNGDPATTGPGSPADGGMDIQTFLEYLVAQGLIVGFAKVDHANLAELQAAISVGGGLLVGEVVTDTQQSEFPGEWTWDPNGANPGGHCTLYGGFDAVDFEQATWAAINKVALAYVENALDEAWFVVSQLHLGSKEFMAGMDLATFATDFQQITGSPTPPSWAPTPDPNPPAPTPGPVETVALAITSPTDGEVLTSATVSVSGTADVDGGVVIYNGEATIGTTSASGGAFSATLTLADGTYDLWVGMSDTDQSAHVSVTVSSQPAPSPVPDPTPLPTPDPNPEPVPEPPDITAPADGDLVTGTVVVTGTGATPDTILLYDGDVQVNVNPIDVSDDSWTISLGLEPGDHTLTATERNALGNLSDSSVAVTFTVQAVPEPPPASDPDAHFAHFLHHRVLDAGMRPTWETWVELRQHAKAWLEARDL